MKTKPLPPKIKELMDEVENSGWYTQVMFMRYHNSKDKYKWILETLQTMDGLRHETMCFQTCGNVQEDTMANPYIVTAPNIAIKDSPFE